MKKNPLFKSIIILLIGGLITKILGMIIKIMTNRLVGINGISLYMLIIPTYMLIISLSQLNLPNTISKLVSEERYNNRSLVLSSIPILLINNILLIGGILLFSPLITKILFKSNKYIIILFSICLVLPFESISNLLRGYYFGKQKLIPQTISQIIEQVTRLILIVLIIPKIIKYSIIYTVSFLFLVNIISELVSIIFLTICLPNKKISRGDVSINKNYIKKILSLSIPTTSARIINNIAYFLEPIILTLVLNKLGYPSKYITVEYGIICGYIMPFLLLPSFFSNAISQALIPQISKKYSNKNKTQVKHIIKTGILFSILVGIPFTLLFMLFPDKLLYAIYHTHEGLRYIYLLAPFFLLLYIETPLSYSLQAMGLSHDIFKISVKSAIFRIISLIIFLTLDIGIWGYIFSIISNIIFSNYLHIKQIIKRLNN